MQAMIMVRFISAMLGWGLVNPLLFDFHVFFLLKGKEKRFMLGRALREGWGCYCLREDICEAGVPRQIRTLQRLGSVCKTCGADYADAVMALVSVLCSAEGRVGIGQVT